MFLLRAHERACLLCKCVCACVCLCVCLCTCMCVCACVYMCACTFVFVCVSLCVCMCVCVCARVRVCLSRMQLCKFCIMHPNLLEYFFNGGIIALIRHPPLLVTFVWIFFNLVLFFFFFHSSPTVLYPFEWRMSQFDTIERLLLRTPYYYRLRSATNTQVVMCVSVFCMLSAVLVYSVVGNGNASAGYLMPIAFLRKWMFFGMNKLSLVWGI